VMGWWGSGWVDGRCPELAEGWMGGWGGVGADPCVRPSGGMGKEGEFWILDFGFWIRSVG